MTFRRPSPLTLRRWRRFKAHRRGYLSLWIFAVLFGLSLFAEVLSNDRPLLIHYAGGYYFPVVSAYPETTFGGDFETEADYKDPYILEKLRAGSNWVLFPPNPHSFQSINPP